MATVGLDYLDPAMSFQDKYFGYFIREYRLTDFGHGGYVSTQIVPVLAAIGLNKLLYSADVFDIRFLAAIYAALLTVALSLIVRANGGNYAAYNIALCALSVLLFADAGYTAYFNSLYGEPVSFLSLLLTVAFALGLARQSRPSLPWLVGYFAAALFLTGAKIQNAPVGVLLALLGLRWVGLRRDIRWRTFALGGSALLLIGSVAMYGFAPNALKRINLYQTVFYGVLKDSPDPRRDLAELGLDPKLAVLAGTNYFTPDTPIPQQSPVLDELFYGKTSHWKVALFYAKHPDRLLDKLETAARHGMTIRPYYLGNYEKSESFPYGAVSDKFNLWSEWKRNRLPNALWFVMAVYAAFFSVVLREWRRAQTPGEKRYAETFACIGFIGAVSFVVPVIGDGEADLGKHLFLFNVCFDAMLASGVLWIVRRLAALPEKWPLAKKVSPG